MLGRDAQNTLALFQVLNRRLCFWPRQQDPQSSQAILRGKLLQRRQRALFSFATYEIGHLIGRHAAEVGKWPDSKLSSGLVERRDILGQALAIHHGNQAGNLTLQDDVICCAQKLSLWWMWPNGVRLSGDGGEADGVRCSRVFGAW